MNVIVVKNIRRPPGPLGVRDIPSTLCTIISLFPLPFDHLCHVLFLPSLPCTFDHRFLSSIISLSSSYGPKRLSNCQLGAGGMRAQPVKIRRPLRSNGQRVVNNTQKLSSFIPLFAMQILSNLRSKLLREPTLHALSGSPPVKSRMCTPPWPPQDAPRSL